MLTITVPKGRLGFMYFNTPEVKYLNEEPTAPPNATQIKLVNLVF